MEWTAWTVCTNKCDEESFRIRNSTKDVLNARMPELLTRLVVLSDAARAWFLFHAVFIVIIVCADRYNSRFNI
ncbi:hypothetical protein Y032_0314g2213 [Ancylostoma ceylanicum]|uniref:Uncharacterized protein n=1 Tax=Ancylostoma ceylanicum TaxID=53326 RepID=A0A016S234_9BILA|nr:hypothetical protein Y032_0314g2213 [Ancylostoma ceylanicum]